MFGLRATAVDRKRLQLASFAFIHLFGSSLDTHVHFHIGLVDGVFEAIGDYDSQAKFHALVYR
jgi:hypothetical protein